jgi:carboxypeptidase C (cathepsin A)
VDDQLVIIIQRMRRYHFRRLAGLAFAACAVTGNAQAPDTQEGIVTTQHKIMLRGKPLAYTATAGRLPIIDNDAGEVHGYMFFVAYTVASVPGEAARPITFLWNGGPGSSSSQVHLLGFGPRRFKTGDSYPTSQPLSTNTPLEDNEETWLDFTDLVFVDPIGTGYSRPTKPEYGAEFYNTVGDAESVAEFIRVYRQRYDRFDSPLFLAGESYGTVRAQWVAEALERRRATVSGVVLISGFLRLDQKPPAAMETALLVPRFTTAAYYHKRLPPELQAGTLQQAIDAANDWARDTFALALERRESVNPLTAAERDAIITELARYSGIKPTLIDPKTLEIPSAIFTDQLLQDQGIDLGRYDTRMTAHRDVAKVPWTTTRDPSLVPVLDLMQGTLPPLIHYLRSDLHYENDLLYRGPFGGAYPAPKRPDGDWMEAHWAQGEDPKGVPAYDPAPPEGASESAGAATIPLISPLHRAMELNPSLRVVVMTGMYDGAADGVGCDLAAYNASLLDVALRGRVDTRCYAGGHMMYTDKLARQEMKRDVEALVRGAGG